MKSIILLVLLLGCVCILRAQKYPEPEFANEVYYLKKDSVNSVVRLEKESSKIDTKTKITGYEQGYSIDGEKSKVRLRSGSSLSFVFSNGASAGTSNGNTTQRDSIMRANGMDPAMMNQAGMGGSMGSMNDPASNIELFKADTDKGKRKVITMKMGGGPFGSKKPTSSDKYTFSVKKIREGYWELVIDKTLPRGEYLFSLKSSTNMDGSSVMYAFGID
jgi:uncharacterized protein YxeA